MNKQEILNYLAEKKRITAPVAAAESNVNKAEQNYEKTTKKWKAGIIVLGVCFAFWFVWLLIGHDTNLFYLDHKLEDLVVHSSLAHSSLLYSI